MVFVYFVRLTFCKGLEKLCCILCLEMWGEIIYLKDESFGNVTETRSELGSVSASNLLMFVNFRD